MNDGELTGRVRTHIADVPEPECALHGHAVAPFFNLRRAALADGFDPVPHSSFRDFARQLAIWNGKFSGQRPMFDASGSPLDASALNPDERIEAILLWSALPGASRHHWGTDIDLIDRNAAPPGYRVQLTQEEFAPAGPFAPLAEWLETNAARFERGPVRIFPPVPRRTVGRPARTLAFQFCPGCRKRAPQLDPGRFA